MRGDASAEDGSDHHQHSHSQNQSVGGSNPPYLGQQWQDGDSRVPSDHRHADAPRVNAPGRLGNESLSSHHVESCHPKHLAGAVRPCPLEYLNTVRTAGMGIQPFKRIQKRTVLPFGKFQYPSSKEVLLLREQITVSICNGKETTHKPRLRWGQCC